MNIIKGELLEMKDRYGDARRTQIVHSEDDITMEDMIPNEEMVITISSLGIDRKSTRLNSSHTVISYAVFCLKKKKEHTPASAISTDEDGTTTALPFSC